MLTRSARPRRRPTWWVGVFAWYLMLVPHEHAGVQVQGSEWGYGGMQQGGTWGTWQGGGARRHVPVRMQSVGTCMVRASGQVPIGDLGMSCFTPWWPWPWPLIRGLTWRCAHTHIHVVLLQAKVEALKEDDNVFDVSFEGQGEDSATASATDVKVCVGWGPRPAWQGERAGYHTSAWPWEARSMLQSLQQGSTRRTQGNTPIPCTPRA